MYTPLTHAAIQHVSGFEYSVDIKVPDEIYSLIFAAGNA